MRIKSSTPPPPLGGSVSTTGTIVKTTINLFFSIALVYKCQYFLSRKGKSQDLSEDQIHNTHISGAIFYQLSYQVPGSKLVGRNGIQVLILGAYYIRKNFLLWNTPGSDNVVTVTLG